MKEIKDIFSKQADTYATFRPESPIELYDFLLKNVSSFETAWDAGTGNGQVAGKLAEYFKTVFATDISQQQLDNAVPKPNITYSLERAEQTSLPDNRVDLITIAQAIHWFDLEAFYKEVNRVAKPDAIIAAWTYTLLQIDGGPIDELINKIYTNILGPYWDKERKIVDERYQTIPFPFEELPCPQFHNKVNWTMEQLKGYLNTWSSAGHFKAKEDYSPVSLIEAELKQLWKEGERKEVIFPIFMRLGSVKK